VNIYKFIDALQERASELEPEAEILVEGEDGTLYDFTIEDTEEVFDGFDTFYPAGLKIVLRK
jgi:hypothetical protein